MTASARDLDLRQHHGVETPEHVDVRFELAGVGSRVAAGLLDLLLLLLGLLLLWLGGTTIASDITPPHGTARGWVTAVLILLTFSLVWGYFTLFEALNGGRTPGKQLLGIRVVMDTGRSLTTQAAVVRNLVRFIDCYFPALPFAPALLAIALHPSNKRLGDMAAGTIVVRDRPTDWTLGLPGTPAPEAPAEAVETGPPDLSEEEFRLLDRFLGRLNELAPDVQARITADLVRRFEPRIPRRTPDLQSYLVTVFAEEQRKRRSRFASRAQAGTAGRITVPAERFVQKKRDGWEAFRTTALRMERSGVGALAAEEIPTFAAQYREVAADLAPARAEELLSPVMVARAEAAAENLAEGRGYAETSKEERPQVAALIITNNITVSFGTFVGGLTAGVLTTWLLFANGMMFGLVLGLFRNYQALSYLLTFVLGHGVLELTAIFISAGAGFRLAKAMIGPVVTLLAIAGTIEGLLSTSPAPASWKYGVSAASAVFLVLYLANGYREAGGPTTRS